MAHCKTCGFGSDLDILLEPIGETLDSPASSLAGYTRDSSAKFFFKHVECSSCHICLFCSWCLCFYYLMQRMVFPNFRRTLLFFFFFLSLPRCLTWGDWDPVAVSLCKLARRRLSLFVCNFLFLVVARAFCLLSFLSSWQIFFWFQSFTPPIFALGSQHPGWSDHSLIRLS